MNRRNFSSLENQYFCEMSSLSVSPKIWLLRDKKDFTRTYCRVSTRTRCGLWYVLCVLHHRFTALNTKARHLCKSFLMRELSVTLYRSREMDLSLLVCVVLVLIISSVCGSSGNSSRFLNKVLVAFLILMFGFTGLSAFLPSLRS